MSGKSGTKSTTISEAIEAYRSSLEKSDIALRVGESTIHFKYRDHEVVLDKGEEFQQWLTYSAISENFKDDQYRFLEVKDNVVVDVGANIADTAITFALRGASHVYAFEPFPYSYNIAKRNIELNNLQDKITVINKGCGKQGTVKLRQDFKNEMYCALSDMGEGQETEIIPLSQINAAYAIPNGSRLKVDCEGCEYDLIMNADFKTMMPYKQIMAEYHYGFEQLSKKLTHLCYDVKYAPPIDFYNPTAQVKEMKMGNMLAELAIPYEELQKTLEIHTEDSKEGIKVRIILKGNPEK